MRILFISPYPMIDASSRFRIYQYLPFLQSKGHQVTVQPFLDDEGYRLMYQPGRILSKAALILAGLRRRFALMVKLRSYDLCVIHREVAPIAAGLVEWLVAKFSRRLVYDFDDALFVPNVSPANRKFGFLKSQRKLHRLLPKCHAVIAGNEYLESYAQKYCDRTFRLPTPVDTQRFVPGTLRLGAVGSAATPRLLISNS